MNIFYLHVLARKAAQYHCDKHVVKMILETAQLLYSAHWELCPAGLSSVAYRKTHCNHPCSIWARESLSNYRWLADLGYWLCKEYRYRYGDKTHKTEAHILWLRENPPCGLVDIGATPPRQAMPDEYKNEHPVVAYRTYYVKNKVGVRNIVKYTRRHPPAFIGATDLHDRSR
jgi:hypothetical protein